MSTWDNENTNDLIEALLMLQNKTEAKKFLRDLCTEHEILEFGKRWKAARMLDEKIPYTKIIETTGLSSTTVARISDWLKNGMGGYKLMFQKIKNHNQSVET